MKNRFLALIAALLCICMLFVSCNEKVELCTTHADANDDGLCDNCEATYVKQAPCTTPADANGDGVCDSCGKHAYVTPEALPKPATPVDMVVNTVPADAVMGDYFSLDYETGKLVLTTSKQILEDQTAIIDSNSKIALIKVVASEEIEDPNYEAVEGEEPKMITEYTETLSIISSDDFTTPIWTATFKYTSEVGALYYEGIEYYAHIVSEYFYVRCYTRTEGEIPEGETEPVYVEEYTYTYYTNSGEKIAELENSSAEISSIDCNNDKTGLIMNGDIYVVDDETSKIEYTTRYDLFVDRPEFDCVIGDYGYYINDGYYYDGYDYVYVDEIQVYNLKNDKLWVDCVYVVDEDEYEDADAYILQNGNILVQDVVDVEDFEINYDYEEYGNKYNVNYYIINPTNGEVKEVEFGYYINDLEMADAEDSQFTDKVLNIAEVSTIKDKVVLDDERYFILDNELNILYEVAPFVNGQEDFEYEVVGKDLLLVEISVGDATVDAVVNTKGEIVCYLPNSVTQHDGYVTISSEYGKFYNYDMTLIIDLVEEEYTIANSNGDSYFLVKTRIELETIEPEEGEEGEAEEKEVEVKEFYFFNPSVMSEPVFIADELTEGYLTHTAFGNYIYGTFGYVVTTYEEVEVEPEEGAEEGAEPTYETVYTYTLYNLAGEEVAAFDTNPVFVGVDAEAGNVIIYVGNAVYYLS